jgi:hypothetical protein
MTKSELVGGTLVPTEWGNLFTPIRHAMPSAPHSMEQT